jgi:SAM-dependent methyltransferase
MGKSNDILKQVYVRLLDSLSLKEPKVAVLGSPGPYFVTEALTCDYFDLSLGNWNINSDWKLDNQYDLIISTRCPYFAKDPHQLINKCYTSLNKNGAILLDWGYGDHWRFPKYKIGWVKDNEHEYCYGKDNFLWSGIWDDSFLENSQFKLFSQWVEKLGYTDVKKAVFEETPSVLPLSYIQDKFDVKVELLALWKDKPQLYVFIIGSKLV